MLITLSRIRKKSGLSYNVGVELEPWTGLDEFRLRLVTRACELRLWVRLYSLAGFRGEL